MYYIVCEQIECSAVHFFVFSWNPPEFLVRNRKIDVYGSSPYWISLLQCVIWSLNSYLCVRLKSAPEIFLLIPMYVQSHVICTKSKIILKVFGRKSNFKWTLAPFFSSVGLCGSCDGIHRGLHFQHSIGLNLLSAVGHWSKDLSKQIHFGFSELCIYHLLYVYTFGQFFIWINLLRVHTPSAGVSEDASE